MFKSIFNTFTNCFKIPELKSRIFFTLVVLAICRLAAVVRVPGLDGAELAAFFERQSQAGNSLMGMYSLFTGGALEHCAIGALGIMPYMLAFAAGAMLYVVVEELVPEYSQGEHSNIGTIGFALGFALMMVLDVVLG